MKTILTLIAGILLGVVLLYAWQGYQYQQVRESLEGAASVYTELSVDNQSFYMAYDSTLMVEDVSTGKKYEVAFAPQQDGLLDYEWMSLNDSTFVGEGSLFEIYKVTGVEPEKFSASVEDAGGSLFMSVGPLSIEWSQGSRMGGWLYYNPKLAALSVKPSP